MKTRHFFPIVVCGVLATVGPQALALEKADVQATVTATTSDWRAKIPASANCADEVVKLVQSGVDQSVVLAYVQNSRVAYNPNADEIIRLRSQGVSSEVISAMLQRGTELRAQAQKSCAPAPAQPVVEQPAAPTYVTAPQTTYVAPAPASSVVYIPYTPRTYSYYAPSYYGYYGGCYPGYSYPSVSFYYGGRSHYSLGLGFGYGGIRVGGHYGGHHGAHHGGFHGGHGHHR